ncbi:MAG: DUF1223 domain-containing protein [Proteobacteria bacterium]|nr:DUF1223 domain-containing protein [Pseudomonadota bacterium]
MTTSLSRRRALALAAASLASPLCARAEEEPAPVLLELFTSQGCANCPAADKLLGELSQVPGIYAVSFNVDYWDYLGWRDTLARPEFSQRQFDYGKSRGDMKAYTPQAVINGRYHVAGNNRAEIERLVAQARAETQLIPMTLVARQDDFTVEMAAAELQSPATLWLMAISPKKEQLIERGENAGNTITYNNVVRNLVPAAMWEGKPFSQMWRKDAVLTGDCTGCLAILQQGKTGPVIGIADWGSTFS